MPWLKENWYWILLAIFVFYWILDPIRHPEDYGAGTLEDQYFEQQDPIEFYAP